MGDKKVAPPSGRQEVFRELQFPAEEGTIRPGATVKASGPTLSTWRPAELVPRPRVPRSSRRPVGSSVIRRNRPQYRKRSAGTRRQPRSHPVASLGEVQPSVSPKPKWFVPADWATQAQPSPDLPVIRVPLSPQPLPHPSQGPVHPFRAWLPPQKVPSGSSHSSA